MWSTEGREALGVGGVDVRYRPRHRGDVNRAPPRATRPGRARTMSEAGWGRAQEPRREAEGLGVGGGEARPGAGHRRLSPGPGLGSGAALGQSLAEIGLQFRGPGSGTARALLSPGAQQETPLQLGQGSRLRQLQTAPFPMARPRRLPPPGQRPPRPPGRLPPPPRAMEPSRPGG